jgi:hypothetical protein
MHKPRSDNREGRLAQLLEDAVGENERLRARIAELENEAVWAEKRAIASEYGRIVGNGPTDPADVQRMLRGLEARCERLGKHEIIPTNERWECAWCGAAGVVPLTVSED